MKDEPIKILLVEDNPDDVRLLHETLTETDLVQFSLTHVERLNPAIERLRENDFDLLLLDLSLPDSQGLDTLIQAHLRIPDVPIIVLTGVHDEELALKTVQGGAQDYLVKGQINHMLLVRTIRYAIERHRLRQELEKQMIALLHSEARFYKMIEHNADSIIIIDQKGLVRFVNPATEALFGCQSDELLDKSFQFPVAAGKVTEVEILRQGDDSVITIAEMRVVETTWDGEPAYLASLRDITARKQVEAALQRAKNELELAVEARTRELRVTNEELLVEIAERKRAEKSLNQALVEAEQARDRLRAILESVADGLIVTDVEYRIVMMNHTAEDVLGIDFNEVANQSIDIVIKHEVLREGIKTALTKNMDEYQFDFEASSRLGPLAGQPKQSQIIRARTAIIKDKTQRPTGLITIMYDITREREIDRMKTEFITTAAHELRTPLTSIQGFSEILLHRENLKPEAQKKYLGYINKQAHALARIVDDMLDISQIESKQSLTLHKIPCSIEQTIRPVVFAFKEKSLRHLFELTLIEPPSEWVVDQKKIEQVLENLLSNAVKYAPAGGLIRIICQWHQQEASPISYYQVSVEDQGIGMTPEQVDKIFNKFYRVDASHTAVGGIGLGMVVVKNIIEAHDGRIWIESSLGKGTTVSFIIPIIRNP